MSVDDEFIDRILEGEASDEEVAEFQRWVKVPANLERFALRAELHSDLQRSLRRRQIEKTALEANIAGRVTDSASSQTERKPDASARDSIIPRSRVGLLGKLTVAGLVTAACLLIAFIWHDGIKSPNTPDAFAASVISDVNGLLTKGGRQWDDADLPVGDYELQEGLLHLQFGGGVMVYVEAPARFDAVSDKRLLLHSGRLSARVPPEGIGFTVETPEAEVVDFGTEFSVDVEGGASEVHVFDGLVRVNPGASNQRDISRSVDVQASQAVRITDATVKPENISVETERFIRNFEEPRLNYARAVKRLSPLAYYRMPIRDRGLVSEPPVYSGIVLTGEGKRPPHGKGVLAGGSLRVGADSIGRGGRVDSPPALSTGRFSLVAFVYLESPAQIAMIATNWNGERGNFGLSLDEHGMLHAAIRNRNVPGVVDEVTSPEPAASRSETGLVTSSTTSGSVLPQKTWRHVVVTADREQLQLYEDGRLVGSKPCAELATSESDPIWFGTNASTTQVWHGRIDEVALFDRALDDEEVLTLYRLAQEEITRSR